MHLIQKAALLAAIALVFYFDGRYRIIPNKLITVVVGWACNQYNHFRVDGICLGNSWVFAGLIILIIPFCLVGSAPAM